ncbi:MAG: hypothetical protein KKH22_02740 [Proteobacteria bacterium]|nr:hypothetical protein [Pseudomonadota bacterium]
MIAYIRTGLFAFLFLTAGAGLPSGQAHAALAADVQNLVVQAQGLDAQLQGITLSGDSICGPLVQADQAARALLYSISQVNGNLAAPLQIDDETLAALEALSAVYPSLASQSLRLSVDLGVVSQTAQAITLKDGIVAMLQLSDDIGAMADRIGEMADKILVMSDNIGLMADRIILTQQIQNQNILVTQQSMLQTQTNILALVSVLETESYNLSLEKLVLDGQLLAARMAAVVLSPWTMKTQLSTVATDVQTYLGKVKAVQATMIQNSGTSTTYINTTPLLNLGNLSTMLTSLASAMNVYVLAIDSLKTITSSTTLSASLKSMLQISADIGLMANRILEMGDLTLAMADNIGMTADQILATQQLQNVNVATTQASILAAQKLAIGIIVARNL